MQCPLGEKSRVNKRGLNTPACRLLFFGFFLYVNISWRVMKWTRTNFKCCCLETSLSFSYIHVFFISPESRQAFALFGHFWQQQRHFCHFKITCKDYHQPVDLLFVCLFVCFHVCVATLSVLVMLFTSAAGAISYAFNLPVCVQSVCLHLWYI